MLSIIFIFHHDFVSFMQVLYVPELLTAKNPLV